MAVPKIIPYDVELRSVNPVRSFDRPKAYTNDRKSVEFQFKILDMTSIELNTATAITLVYMRDGSFFANPSTDVERVGNVFSYLLKENEGNHAGVAQIQLVVTIDDAEFASQLFDFEIINGLETKVAQEVMIYDWTTLTRDARAYIDQFVADEVFRDAQFDNAQFDRNVAFVSSQESRDLAFGVEQTNRGAAFTAEQTNRNTAFTNDQDARALTFSESETGRTAAESGRVTAESNRVTAESGRVTKESQRVTAETNRVTAEGNRATAESGRVTAENNRVTTFAGYNARITNMEDDVNFNGTNGLTNGDFSSGTASWGANRAVISAASNVLTATGNVDNTTFFVSGGTNIDAITNNVLYVRTLARTTSSGISLLLIESQSTLGSGSQITSISSPIQNTWYSISGTIKSTSIVAGKMIFAVRLADPINANAKVLEVKNCLMIDLTATFGAGNEPTAEQMDRILSQFTNSWFNGTQNLFQAKQELVKRIALDTRTEFDAKNEVVNGDFSNGTTGWGAGGGTVSASSNTLTITGNGTSALPLINNQTTAPLIVGRKYYMVGKTRVTNSLCTTIRLRLRDSGGVLMGTAKEVSAPVSGTWYQLTGIVTVGGTPTGNATVSIQHDYADAATALDKAMEVQYVALIDLTVAFGAGKEPTLAEMDRLMARLPNSWFDGVKPIQTIETLYQEKANKVQEAWITPTLSNGWIAETGRTIKYFKDEFGNVKISGRIKGGTVGAIIFTLPTGYRPSEPYGVPVICSGGTLGFLEVTTAGNVVLVIGTNTYCEIQTVNFRV